MSDFEALLIGQKKPEKKATGMDSSDGDSKGSSFGEDAAGMAVRALAKAFGIDPSEVDVPKATKALRAIVAACKSGKPYDKAKATDEADDEEEDSEE